MPFSRTCRDLLGSCCPAKSCLPSSAWWAKTHTTTRDEEVTFVLRAKDGEGGYVCFDGAIVEARPLACQNHSGADCKVETTVIDKGKGYYTISCTPRRGGVHSVAVTVYGELVPFTLSIHCHFSFDKAECQVGNTISEDGLTVTHTGEEGWSYVLGTSQALSAKIAAGEFA